MDQDPYDRPDYDPNGDEHTKGAEALAVNSLHTPTPAEVKLGPVIRPPLLPLEDALELRPKCRCHSNDRFRRRVDRNEEITGFALCRYFAPASSVRGEDEPAVGTVPDSIRAQARSRNGRPHRRRGTTAEAVHWADGHRGKAEGAN